MLNTTHVKRFTSVVTITVLAYSSPELEKIHALIQKSVSVCKIKELWYSAKSKKVKW